MITMEFVNEIVFVICDRNEGRTQLDCNDVDAVPALGIDFYIESVFCVLFLCDWIDEQYICQIYVSPESVYFVVIFIDL